MTIYFFKASWKRKFFCKCLASLFISISSLPISVEIASCCDHLLCHITISADTDMREYHTKEWNSQQMVKLLCWLPFILFLETSLSLPNYFLTNSWSSWRQCQSIKGACWRRLNCLLTQHHLGPLTFDRHFIKML